MSLPVGVSTCLVTYGPITDTFGNVADSITVEVVADRTIVHGASGRTLFKNPVVVTADNGGIAQLAVPHTNQSGFRDQNQNALTGWYYTIRLTARFGRDIQTDSKTFQPIVGQTTVDADLLPSDGMVTPGVTAPIAEVTSVAGQTGEVEGSALAAALVGDLSHSFVPQWAPATNYDEAQVLAGPDGQIVQAFYSGPSGSSFEDDLSDGLLVQASIDSAAVNALITAALANVGGGSGLDRFHRQLATDPANTKIALLGDSKSHVTTSPTTVPSTGPIAELVRALRAECQAGGQLAGMNPANIGVFGNNGVRLDTFLTQESTGANPGSIVGNPWSSVVAFAPHLLIAGWLTNDFRDNSTGPLTTTAAQGRARLETLIGLGRRDLPNTDIILRKSGAYTSTIGPSGTTSDSYFVGTRTAADCTALMSATYGAFEGKYSHVVVYDPVRVFGAGVYPTSTLMQDQLHANTMGYRAEGRDLLRVIAPPAAAVTQLGPKASYMRFGVVQTTTASLIEIRPLTYTTGLGLPIENTPQNWIVDASTGVLYGPLGSRALTAATKSVTSEPGTLQINDTGANWATTVGPVGSIVQLNASGFTTEGASSDAVLVGVRLPAITAGATIFQTVTVPGVKVGIGGTPGVYHGVLVSPAPQLPAGLVLGNAVVTATDTVKVPVTNTTVATVADLGYPLGWNFYIVR